MEDISLYLCIYLYFQLSSIQNLRKMRISRPSGELTPPWNPVLRVSFQCYIPQWQLQHWKTIWISLKKLRIELLYDSAILLLGIYPKNRKTLIQKGVCTLVFIAALFRTAMIRKQPIFTLTDKWIKKVWYMFTTVYRQWILPSVNYIVTDGS